MSDLDDYVAREVRRLASAVDASEVLPLVERRFRRRRRHRAYQRTSLVIVVLAGTGLGAFGLLRLFAHSSATMGGATKARIASTTVGGDLRVTLVAERRSSSKAAASVAVVVSMRRDGTWVSAGRAGKAKSFWADKLAWLMPPLGGRCAHSRAPGEFATPQWQGVLGAAGLPRRAGEDRPGVSNLDLRAQPGRALERLHAGVRAEVTR